MPGYAHPWRYEIYYSISGGKQFLIDNYFYDISNGDIFLINQFESHYLTQIDQQKHERIILSIDPEYLKQISTETTNLNHCFQFRGTDMPHQLHLSQEEQTRFIYFIHKLRSNSRFGEDILDHATFLELMVFLNHAFDKRCRASAEEESKAPGYHARWMRFSPISIPISAKTWPWKNSLHIFSWAVLIWCRFSKPRQERTINKYITAKRITISKSLLSQGYSVNEACEACGFNDYSNYLKAFTKAVGISPKKYAQFNS